MGSKTCYKWCNLRRWFSAGVPSPVEIKLLYAELKARELSRLDIQGNSVLLIPLPFANLLVSLLTISVFIRSLVSSPRLPMQVESNLGLASKQHRT